MPSNPKPDAYATVLGGGGKDIYTGRDPYSEECHFGTGLIGGFFPLGFLAWWLESWRKKMKIKNKIKNSFQGGYNRIGALVVLWFFFFLHIL